MADKFGLMADALSLNTNNHLNDLVHNEVEKALEQANRNINELKKLILDLN